MEEDKFIFYSYKTLNVNISTRFCL
jgi:hypothetical protein